MKFLFDTNIISELAKSIPNPGVLDWVSGIKECGISVITIEELYYGLSWKPNIRVQTWIDDFIDKYAVIFPVTQIIAKNAGIIRGQLQSKGISRTQADLLIAATASAHGLTVVTRNTDDFEGCGISVFNPFT